MAAECYIVDLQKPLVFQVGYLGEDYDDWVHKAIVSKETPRFFANGFLETLLEYSLHRFLFHVRTTSYWGNTFHYLIHGCHHKHPMDGLRLVFPPLATALLLVPLWSLIKSLAPAPVAPAVLAGGLFGYVMYDCTHYYLHHARPSKGYSYNLKRYHMNHHFRVHNKGFGITSSFWDTVFRTLPPKFLG